VGWLSRALRLSPTRKQYLTVFRRRYATKLEALNLHKKIHVIKKLKSVRELEENEMCPTENNIPRLT
jgi:hypothetical protein